MNIVTKALDYYDANREKYDKFLSKIKSFRISERKSSDMDHSTIIFFDANNNQVWTTRYEVLGTYYSESNTWAWSWAKANSPKNQTYLARKILNYGLNIDIDMKITNASEKVFLKTELITSRFRINDPVQLDVHIALSSYISKIPIIIPFVYTYTGKKEELNIFSKRKYFYDYYEIFRLKNYYISFLFALDYENIVL